ncbi:glycosyltransferase family 4 protein [Neobacillus sp. SCS-31]|uniref:glycosyltransferase family 4 protein n=1 Tax=Neobacillus oceani TaxID=3115292 RepID=UPI003906BE01
MNIWIFNHYATAPTHVGGTRHYDLAKHLTDKGYNVTIFASSFNHFSKKEMVFKGEKSEYKSEMIDGVKYVWIHTPPYETISGRVKNIISYTWRSHKIGRAACSESKPDIVVGSSVHPLAAIVGYLISKKAGCKFYFEERDLWPQTFVDFGKLSPGNPVAVALYRLESFLYKKADRIIVLFDKAKYYIQARGINPNKVIYLPNGVDLSKYDQLEKSVEIDILFSKLKNKFVIVYAGSHGVANHLEPIIELFAKLKNNPDLHLLLVGNGPEKSRLMEKAEQEGIRNITFHDAIPKTEIPYLLSKAQMGILSIMDSPLYYWGFSMNKIYDYMAAGLPIIMITDPDLIGSLSNQTGIYANNDLDETARWLEGHYRNPKLLEREGSQLKKYAEQNYCWGKLADSLETFIVNDVSGVK